RATTGCGIDWMVFINLVQAISSARIWPRSAPAMSAKSWPAENTLPRPPRITPRASLAPTSSKAAVSASMCSSERALRFSGMFIQMVVNGPSRRTSGDDVMHNGTADPDHSGGRIDLDDVTVGDERHRGRGA